MPLIPAVHLLPGDEVVSPEGELRRIVAVDKTERYAPLIPAVRVDFHDGSSEWYGSSHRLSVRPR